MSGTPSPAEEGGRQKLCWCGHAESSHVAPSLGALVGGVWGCMECYDAEPNGLSHTFSTEPAEEGGVPTTAQSLRWNDWTTAAPMSVEVRDAWAQRALADPNIKMLACGDSALFSCYDADQQTYTLYDTRVRRTARFRAPASPVSSGTDESLGPCDGATHGYTCHPMRVTPSAQYPNLVSVDRNDLRALADRFCTTWTELEESRAALRTAQARVEELTNVNAALEESWANTRAALAVSQDRERELERAHGELFEERGRLRAALFHLAARFNESEEWDLECDRAIQDATLPLRAVPRPSSLEGSSDA